MKKNINEKDFKYHLIHYLWITLLIIGIIPFIIPIVFGASKAINGASIGLCLSNCYDKYGLPVFFEYTFFYSIFFWPTYIVGFCLIILSVIKLKRYKKK